ncbi:MAG: hypothetical protein AAB701_03260 [Patescibacteria group bacterium]
MIPVTRGGSSFTTKESEEETIAVAMEHVVLDMKNKQCCKTDAEILHSLQNRSLRIWCPDPRGRTPRYCNLGGSGAVPLRLIDAFLRTIPRQRVDEVVRILASRFTDFYDEFRGIVLPCTHTDKEAILSGNDCGCGYLNYLRKDAGDYDFADGSLVTRLLKSRKEDDEYEVLAGDRQAALGALIIRCEEDAAGRLLCPLPKITPTQLQGAYFVWHPQIASRLIDFVAERMFDVLQDLSSCFDTNFKVFRAHLRCITKKHMEITYQKLAPGKPIFHVYIASTGRIDVSIRDGL